MASAVAALRCSLHYCDETACRVLAGSKRIDALIDKLSERELVKIMSRLIQILVLESARDINVT